MYLHGNKLDMAKNKMAAFYDCKYYEVIIFSLTYFISFSPTSCAKNGVNMLLSNRDPSLRR